MGNILDRYRLAIQEGYVPDVVPDQILGRGAADPAISEDGQTATAEMARVNSEANPFILVRSVVYDLDACADVFPVEPRAQPPETRADKQL
jgi:hypothetical protein